MTPETAFNITLIAIAIAAIGLFISELRMNLLAERAKDRARAGQDTADGADVEPDTHSR